MNIMKIQGPIQIGNVNGKYNEVARKNYASTASLIGSDKVEFSQNAKSFSAALKAAKELPEVRTEKVEALRKAISEGTYRIDSNAVAEKLISSITL